MPTLELRPEFQSAQMQSTAIELRNDDNTGWTQRNNANELLEITYPTADVRRALLGIDNVNLGRPVVLLGQRGSGKSHIMALLHFAFQSPASVQAWAHSWGSKPDMSKLGALALPQGFLPISETLMNNECLHLWDVIFKHHPKGDYYRGKFESSGSLIPSKSLLIDIFKEKRTALILDELQTWYDGQHDSPGDTGMKRLSWAFSFMQTLAEIASERPDLFCLVTSVRNSNTESYRQIHRVGELLINFSGESSRDDRKKLALHRLFKNRSNVGRAEVEGAVNAYATARNELLYAEKPDVEQQRHREEVIESWPFSPELINLLEDHFLMAAATQSSRDMIRILAEVYRIRGSEVPVITPADFSIDDDECGVVTFIDALSTNADNERLRDRALKNLESIRASGISAPHACEVISSIWMRSLSVASDPGATRSEVQVDITRTTAIDTNQFTVELQAILQKSWNIHETWPNKDRYCFQIPVNPDAKLKAFADADNNFAPQVPTAPGLLPVRRDQVYMRDVLTYVLRSPDGTTEQPSRPIVLDPNWEKSPWANVPASDQPNSWAERAAPVLLVIPESPKEIAQTLGPWIVEQVPVNRNMLRFLLPISGMPGIYDDRELIITARCALLAKEWKDEDAVYKTLHGRYESDLKKKLRERFDRYAILGLWDFQTPQNCTFHVESHGKAGADIPSAIESHVRDNFFAPEDFQQFVVDAASRNDTMKQLLALLRETPLPGKEAIPYLGESAIYDQVLRLASRDRIALNVGGRWFRKEADETPDEALTRLRQRAFRTGHDLHSIELGDPSQVGSTGLTVPPTITSNDDGESPGGPTLPPPIPISGGSPQSGVPGAPFVPPVGGSITLTPQPVIRQSIGAKTGINLLGDLEKWALPDKKQVTQATLTMNGVSVKELRELCTKLPPRLQAELQITMPPEVESES